MPMLVEMPTPKEDFEAWWDNRENEQMIQNALPKNIAAMTWRAAMRLSVKRFHQFLDHCTLEAARLMAEEMKGDFEP